MTQTVESNFGVIFLYDHRCDFHLGEILPLAEVVDQTRWTHDVHAAETIGAGDVIVIAMNAEDWNCDIEIFVLVVDTAVEWVGKVFVLVAEELEVDGLVAENIGAEEFDASKIWYWFIVVLRSELFLC